MIGEHELFIRDNAGHLRYWKCYEVAGGIEIEHGVVDGTPQFQFESIEDGKAGRNQDEQIESRINSRVNKQLQKGYVYSRSVAETMKPMNLLGFHKPMLAKKQSDVDIPLLRSKGFYLQNKLDGNRCLVHNDGVKLTAYTRNGKPINTIDHILEELDGLIPEGVTIDGELYLHGTPLQTLVSWIKRKQPNTKKVEYHIYDMISDNSFGSRSNELGAILSRFKGETSYPIKLVETTYYEPENSVDLGVKLREAREKGFEGLMFRSDYSLVRGKLTKVGYEDGKRSGSLVKFKGWESEEFKVVDIIPSKEGWARLVCEHIGANGRIKFTVSCPGEMTFRYYVMTNKEHYVGKYVTCDFAYWTQAGVPFHPTAIAFRDYE